MSGGQVGADQAFERARPVFGTVGKRLVHIGGPGVGQVAERCNQTVVTLTRKSGVDGARVRQTLPGGLAQSRMLDGNFKPGLRINWHRKDLCPALEAGREQDAPLSATAGAAVLMDALLAQGRDDLDPSALHAQLAGLDGA
ncbi:NAD-binding protein [Deinococcus petrolearius]|uniref:NAD-binding protein n=1 Tax=Deinococcus petrolearius TaxID=1751295 RepID=A0ABW1DDP3_9DEIO